MSAEQSRRAFLLGCGKILGTAALAAISLPVLQGCEPTSIPSIPEVPGTNPVDPDGRIVVSIADLTPANPVKKTSLKGPDGRSVLVTRKSDTEYFALSMMCTHAGCDVTPQAIGGVIPCACHGSQFHLDGSVAQAPATEPLPHYDAIVDLDAQVIKILLA